MIYLTSFEIATKLRKVKRDINLEMLMFGTVQFQICPSPDDLGQVFNEQLNNLALISINQIKSKSIRVKQNQTAFLQSLPYFT